MEKQIVVLAATTQDTLACKGADVEDMHCQTLAEAKQRAKYYLTQEYMQASETSVLLGYSQVVVNGECLYDYYRKGVS